MRKESFFKSRIHEFCLCAFKSPLFLQFSRKTDIVMILYRPDNELHRCTNVTRVLKWSYLLGPSSIRPKFGIAQKSGLHFRNSSILRLFTGLSCRSGVAWSRMGREMASSSKFWLVKKQSIVPCLLPFNCPVRNCCLYIFFLCTWVGISHPTFLSVVIMHFFLCCSFDVNDLSKDG